jgi:hypothetical protein
MTTIPIAQDAAAFPVARLSGSVGAAGPPAAPVLFQRPDPSAGTLPPARRAWLVGADGPSTVLTRFKLLLASHSCSAHSTKANNGIPIVTTFSSVSGALTEQLIFEFASLSSWPMDCADFLRNLISIRTAIPHYLNKYRTITTTDTKASTQLLRSRELLRRASGRKCNQKASGESIECHALHS